MSGWGFASPWLLAGLAVLPAIWWLLRVSPPAPLVRQFPAWRLLAGLEGPPSAARTPPWLLALRLVAAACVIVGLAGPERRAAGVVPGEAPLVVVMDDGWASAHDWADRTRAAADLAGRLARPKAALWVMGTAAPEDGSTVAAGPEGTVADVAARLGALRPMPWSTDRRAAARALAELPGGARVIYVSDGVAGEADAAFAGALRRLGPVWELKGARPAVLLRPPVVRPDRLEVRAETVGLGLGPMVVRALDATGAALGEADMVMGVGGQATGTLVLPPAVRNRAAMLRVMGEESAGSAVLLDESARRRPVGLLSGTGADQPLLGSLFFVRQALEEGADVREGPLGALLTRPLAVIVMADGVVEDADSTARLTGWVRDGGVLVRFAGPAVAAETRPDALLPAPLLSGDRVLGGTMSWASPAGLAPFPAGSPFLGLAVPADVKVTRQVLAAPGGQWQVWAALADGTPLVTAAPLGAGRLVLFHVTANTEWSNLPLSGLFPQMLGRIVRQAAGVATAPTGGVLVPRRVLDGYGVAQAPGASVRPVQAADMGRVAAGPAHPPGWYGPEASARALNLGDALPPLKAASEVPGAQTAGLDVQPAARSYEASLLVAALLLLAVDAGAALVLRGLVLAAVALVFAAGPALAQAVPVMPSLETHLAFVRTGDTQADGVAEAGLAGLSQFVNARTAAALAAPVGVDASRDDLSFYPLLYWPMLAGEAVPDGATLARLSAYMQDGGIILFDTRDGDAPDAAAREALRQIGAALSLPALAPLTRAHVLTRSFYLLREWPGRDAGGTVWVAREEDRSNDGVSPVIVGAGDWAAAWASDAAGDALYPTGDEQRRLLAFRFGVNLVMYALTGNYKADQVHVPELLRRMGVDQPP